MRMSSTKLKMLKLRVHMTVFVMAVALMLMKHECMGIGFISQIMVFFGHEVKATERSPSDKLTQWIITRSKGVTRKH